jgi:hypothetical protein
MVGDRQSDTSNTQRRFAAFISYAHADAAIAAKLQSRLERYRLPKHLAESHSGGNAALGQIFRDREDLAAAPSLSDAIRAAIAEADALVVICSPDAQASRWVGEEIALFRALHPDKAILAAVVRGAPVDAFPAALTEGGNEPLAADLRKEGDGEALGFLKIVAGIAGVPLDALVQRDAQRRIRRVMWITGSAIAAMLVMGVMTTLAIQARNEAARQRAEAEGLVEYMLTDLRDKLKGVGRVEVHDAVNQRAMEYYGNQGDLASLPPDSIERRARVLHAMGEDYEKAGDIGRAAKKFSEAHRATSTLLSRAPKNADYIFAHGQSEYWVGFAAWRNADAQTTDKYWRGYLRQAEALATAEPDSVRSLMELGYSHGNMCELLMNKQRDVTKGLDHCRKSISFAQRALVIDPADKTNQMALANRLGWLADALVTVKSFDEAIAHRQAEQRLIDQLAAADPGNVEIRVRQTWPQIGLGKIAEARQETDKAVTILSKVLRDLKILTSEYPDSFNVLEYRVRTNIILARALRTAARPQWRSYRNEAAALIDDAKITKKDGLPRMSAMLAKFDGGK